MPNLRELAESDLGTTLEGDFALPVELIDPDGVKQSLVGQVLYDTVEFNPETGEPAGWELDGPAARFTDDYDVADSLEHLRCQAADWA